MSKAFTKEDDAIDAPLLAEDQSLPSGTPNYVTPGGLARLRHRVEALAAELAATPSAERARREHALATLARRLEVAVVIDPANQPADEVRFGATVDVRDERGVVRTIRIVGVDEADAKRGWVSWRSPLADALMGQALGDVAELTTPSGTSELEIVAIRYTPPSGTSEP